MRVFVIGATGATGIRLSRLLVDQGHSVTGLYRQQGRDQALTSVGANGALGDLSKMDAAQLAQAAKGSDVIVFTAGAGGGDSDAMIDVIDGAGLTKSIDAAKAAGIGRLILVSVFPEAGRGGDVDQSFEHYIAVKKQAEVDLVRSDLDWVILRPSVLTNDPGTGLVQLSKAELRTKISRDDVAAVIAALVGEERISREILELRDGTTPVSEAVLRQLP